MLLWNAVVPHIFGLTKLTFWYSVGLLMLSNLLLSKTGSNFIKGAMDSINEQEKKRKGIFQ